MTAPGPDAPIPVLELARQAIESLPGVGMIVVDRDLRIVLAAGSALDGRGPKESIGKSLHEVGPSAVRQRYIPLYERALAGETVDVEFEGASDDGVYRTVLTPLRDGDEVVGVIAAMHDVTARSRAERAQVASERARDRDRVVAQRRFELAFGSAPSGIAIIDPTENGRLSLVNGTLCRMLGYDAAELAKLTSLDITHPDDRETSRIAIRKVEEGTIDTWSEDKRLIDSDGNVVWVTSSVAALRDNDGSIAGRVVHIQDITGRKLAMLENERQARRMKTAFDRARTGIGLMKPNGRWRRVNPALAELCGYPIETLEQMSVTQLMPAEDVNRFRAGRLLILGGETGLVEHTGRVRTGNGDELIVRARATPVYDEHHQVQHFIVEVEDVTEQQRDLDVLREREREAATERDAALEASALKSRFVANVSHELRTPMNGVIGMLELLQNSDGLTAEQQQLVATAATSADMLLAVINDVLDISKIESGSFELHNEPVTLDRLATEVRVAFGIGASDKGLTLTVEREADVPDVVRTDPLRLRQVLVNLVGNAIKFTDEGTVRLTIGRAVDKLRFEVRDTGIGVAAADREQLFDAFHQADGSSTRRHGGTGLGLAISREIVNRMGGEIGVADNPEGAGSMFWFTVPLEGSSEAPRPAKAGTVAGDAAADLKGRAVLVAEDDPVGQELAVRRLEMRGIDADIVATGHDAVEQCARRPYDLVLMDCYMPVLDGFSATERIRSSEAGTGRRTPIVAMTAGALDDERERCREVGMDDFLAKPVRQAELDAVLERWLGGGAG